MKEQTLQPLIYKFPRMTEASPQGGIPVAQSVNPGDVGLPTSLFRGKPRQNTANGLGYRNADLRAGAEAIEIVVYKRVDQGERKRGRE